MSILVVESRELVNRPHVSGEEEKTSITPAIIPILPTGKLKHSYGLSFFFLFITVSPVSG